MKRLRMDRENPAQRLLEWFEVNRRDLPWRREPRDPYHVWISEIMLQQTQVQTVIGYFDRWIDRFPDIPALAAASLDAVLKAWEGLGYYTRARNLHRAAGIIAEEYGGRLPRRAAELQRLPGIGPYTAAAIASLAFGEDVVAVDGNIRRVVSRLFTVGKEVTRKDAARLLDPFYAPGQAGRVNEALMELGALCCVPGTPTCEGCPLRPVCGAYHQGNPGDFPVMKKRKSPPRVSRKGVLLLKGNSLYLIRRPEGGMLGGLWGIPLIEGEVSGVRSIEAVLEDVSHAYSHFRITVTPFVVSDRGDGTYAGEGGRFIPLEEIPHLALSTLDHKILKRLRDYREARKKQGRDSLDRNSGRE